jgi:hypothetical protein
MDLELAAQAKRQAADNSLQEAARRPRRRSLTSKRGMKPINDLLVPLRHTAKRIFGGFGIMLNDTMFALLTLLEQYRNWWYSVIAQSASISVSFTKLRN